MVDNGPFSLKRDATKYWREEPASYIPPASLSHRKALRLETRKRWKSTSFNFPATALRFHSKLSIERSPLFEKNVKITMIIIIMRLKVMQYPVKVTGDPSFDSVELCHEENQHCSIITIIVIISVHQTSHQEDCWWSALQAANQRQAGSGNTDWKKSRWRASIQATMRWDFILTRYKVEIQK